MDEEYVPDYAPGQIVVEFYGKNDIYVRGLCETLGLELIGKSSVLDAGYVIKTEPGKEQELIRKLELPEYKRFIETTGLRDLKEESRKEIYEELEEKVILFGGLIPTSLSNKDYQRKLNEIQGLVDKLRKI